jgi:hypothetical protein
MAEKSGTTAALYWSGRQINEYFYRDGFALAQSAPVYLAAQLPIYPGYVRHQLLGAIPVGWRSFCRRLWDHRDGTERHGHRIHSYEGKKQPASAPPWTISRPRVPMTARLLFQRARPGYPYGQAHECLARSTATRSLP